MKYVENLPHNEIVSLYFQEDIQGSELSTLCSVLEHRVKTQKKEIEDLVDKLVKAHQELRESKHKLAVVSCLESLGS